MAVEYAVKYRNEVDEKFTRKSIATMATNRDYDFTGVQTVKVYSIPVAPMGDYRRTGKDRYGTPTDLGNEAQTLTLTQDRCFTFVIDRGDKDQTQMTLDAGKALIRQLDLAVVPEYDTYVFKQMALAACKREGHYDVTRPTKTNAYEKFLHAQEVLGDANVPDSGRVCLSSYKFANLMKQDPAFMVGGDVTQEMKKKGVMGEVDGVTIIKVPASRLPADCDFIMTHPIACTAPKTLESYRVHDNPPGINGWLVEGRIIYDAFILNNKADAVFYQGVKVEVGP